MQLPKPKQKPNGKWLIQVMVDGHRVSKQFDTEDEALYWAAGIKTSQKEAEAKQKDPTLKEAFSFYTSGRSNILSPTTLRSYKIVQENYFADLMGKKCSKIDAKMIQAEINKMAADKSPKTIKNNVGYLLTVLSQYKDIDKKKLTFPQREEKEHSYLEGPDIAKLIDAIRGHRSEIPVLLALWLGLRRSEICALEWSDFDFDRKTVSVSKAVVPNSDNKYVLKKTTKTVKSKRTLSVPEYVFSRLEELQPDVTKRVGRVYKLNPNLIYNDLSAICKEHGIPFVGVHGLRHTNASVMLSVGITTKMAMARGGWSSNKTMQTIYQHLFSEDKTKADEIMNDYFEKLISGPQNQELQPNLQPTEQETQ